MLYIKAVRPTVCSGVGGLLSEFVLGQILRIGSGSWKGVYKHPRALYTNLTPTLKYSLVRVVIRGSENMYNTDSHELAILRVCKICGNEAHKVKEMEKVGEFYHCHFCLLEGDDYHLRHSMIGEPEDNYADSYSNNQAF